MAIRHQVKDFDTVESLAFNYLGDSEAWRQIVTFNRLVYPYLSTNPEDRYIPYAKGFIRLTRRSTNNPLTIPAGWTVSTKRQIMGMAVKTYRIIEPVTFAVGQAEAYAYIRSIVPGIQGNAARGSVTQLGPEFANNGVSVEITNDEPISGGLEGFVRTTGEYIFIPTEDDLIALENRGEGFTYDEIRYFYGEDLKIENEDLVFNRQGDLQTVAYLENVKQSVQRRLEAPVGSYLLAFDFGTNLSDIIGDNSLPYDAKERLIRIEVLQALNADDRIENPEIVSVRMLPDKLAVEIVANATVVNIGEEISLRSIVIGGV